MAISGWGVFLIILVVIVAAAAGGYVAYAHYRARRLGLPPPNFNPFSKTRRNDSTYRAPAPAPGGIVDWFKDKWHSVRNPRTTTGAYESTGYGNAGRSTGDRRGFGPLDPDEAWSAHVDHEASGYYEEQELGDPGHGPYGGSGYGVGVGGIEEGRGRSRSRQRELDARYDEEVHGGAPARNPFGDDAQGSMRSLSPRPDTTYRGGSGGEARAVSAHKKNNASLGTTGSNDDSPTERRSMFREAV